LIFLRRGPPVVVLGHEFRAICTAFAASLGVKLGVPGARIVCVTGDGSFMMEQQELATAHLHNIPVLAIILRNNAYGGMKRDQLHHYGGRVIGTELFVPTSGVWPSCSAPKATRSPDRKR
jgi:thiamine pyrophosphate-dependent acetolactate synthase large subunit-like protein